MVGKMGRCWMCWLLGNKTKVKLARFDQKHPKASNFCKNHCCQTRSRNKYSIFGFGGFDPRSMQDLCRSSWLNFPKASDGIAKALHGRPPRTLTFVGSIPDGSQWSMTYQGITFSSSQDATLTVKYHEYIYISYPSVN